MRWQKKSGHDVERNPVAYALPEVRHFDDPRWIINFHRRNIIVKISENDEDKLSAAPDHEQLDSSQQSYRINLVELQRLRLTQLQHKLVQHAVSIRYDPEEPLNWADDLRKYVQALQDFNYMEQQFNRPNDPFYVTGQRYIDRNMLRVAMDDQETDDDPLRSEKTVGKWETADCLPNPIGGTRDKNFIQARIKGLQERLVVAATAAIFLIGPMWLMVLHNTLWTALVSTTVFVAVFGMAMAFFLDGLMDVMSSTAAYAAVLVVFVGLSVTPNH